MKLNAIETSASKIFQKFNQATQLPCLLGPYSHVTHA